MHAPTELKEKIFELMNERVKLLSDIERNTYLLSKKRYTGADKRNVKRQNRAMKRTARQKEDDIYFFIKKAQKQDESHVDGAHRLGWLVLAVLIALGIGVLYWLAKYYWRLF
jgi:cytochrome c1